jgi:hypothetical protein
VLREVADGLRFMYDGARNSPWAGYRHVDEMLSRRDAALKALLTTGADSARYTKNAAAMH